MPSTRTLDTSDIIIEFKIKNNHCDIGLIKRLYLVYDMSY